MPRIQEYTAEESAAGPQAAMSPNTELIGAEGRGLEKFGAGLEIGASAIYKRQSQMDSGAAFGDVINYKVQQLQQQDQQMMDGSYDVDKHKQELYDWQNEQAAKYETPAGQQMFMRQSNRMIGSLLARGVHAQKTIAANNAAAQYADNINSLATATRLAPDTFEDNIAAAYEHSDSLPEGAQDKADLHAEDTLAREAIKGWAETNPDYAMEKLKDKNFAQYLNPKSYDELHNLVEHAQKNKANEEDVASAQAKRASKAAAEKYMSDNLTAIANGKLKPNDVLLKAPSDVDFTTRLAMAEKAKQAQGLSTQTTPAVMHDYMDRLLLPKDDPRAITSIGDLYKEKGLAPNDISKLSKWYLQTPQGAAEKQSEKLMMNDIKGKLKIPGMPDQDYDNRVVNAMHDYQTAKQKMIKDGKDPSALTDPKSKDYFPLQVRPASPIETMQKQAAIMTGQGSPSGNIVYTSPGITPPQAKDEIERKTKDGRTAIFDAKTKNFLRYK